MSGYSQGGQLVHNAAKLLPASTMAQVSSVVIFGDPGKLSFRLLPPIKQFSNAVLDFGEAVAGAASSITKVICHLDDDICKQGDLILLAHLTYSENAQEAATFAATAAGMALGN
jgi:cutinase